MGGKIGILLTTSPEWENSFTVSALAEAALAKGHQVHIFLMADGVYNCLDKGFVSLMDKGAQITICEQNAKDRNLKIDAPVVKGSLYDLAVIMAEVDRFLSFT